jgi:hypothetical protein
MPEMIRPRVLHIIHNPRIPAFGNRKLNDVFGWNDPDQNAAGYQHAVQQASHGLVNYEIEVRVEVDGFPIKADGFQYTPASYLDCWANRGTCHQPDGVDYHALLDQFDVLPQINSGAIDEIWLSAFPYAGYYESRMGGPGAFWCNAPPLDKSRAAGRRFVIMGFNFERGVGEMLENLGHRAESILSVVFRDTPNERNYWKRFIRYDATHPGQAECGNVHFAPNSERDYDWGNPRRVPSQCDNWLNFPDLSGPARLVDASEWGGGGIFEHHTWWFRHFPHVDGESDGISYNWWTYVINPNQVPV